MNRGAFDDLMYLLEKFPDALTHLHSSEQEIIRRRFGLDGHAPEMQKTIAADRGVSSTRIHQLEHSGLRKLRVKYGMSLGTGECRTKYESRQKAN